MINKITPFKPNNSVNSSKNNCTPKNFTPSFQAIPDEFIRPLSNPPKPIKDAIQSLIGTISERKFQNATEAFLNPDPAQIKLDQIMLRASKIKSSELISLKVEYSKGASANGSEPITKGTAEQVSSYMRQGNFIRDLVNRIRRISDDVFYNENMRIDY